MRPFGCPVTILNTLDPLRKFDGKADEGFFVGYSINCKAFRVFSSRTQIVQETLHIIFLKNKPNVAGIGPKWLFNIDTLTMSMNYQPAVAGNQPNDNACIKEHLDAGKVGKETVSTQQYVLLPLWSSDLQDPKNTYDNVANDAFEVKENENGVHVFIHESDKTDKNTNRVNAVIEPVNVAGPNTTNNTNSFNTAIPYVNVVSPKFGIAGQSSFVDPFKYLNDPDMPELEDIVYSDYKEDVGVEADLSNLETNIPISPIPTTRVHKDYHVNQIIDVKSASTLFEIEKPLLKDPNGEDVDIHLYRYLKGKPHLGLWYPRDSPFNLVAYSHSDYAEASLDRKSIIGELAIPKQTALGKGFSNPFMAGSLPKTMVINSPCCHNEESTIPGQTTTDASNGFDQIVDFLNAHTIKYALVVNPTIYVSCIKQFWATATVEKVNGGVQLKALIDDKKRTAWNKFSSSMASAVICLATGRKFNFLKYIFDSMVRNVDSPSKFLMYPCFIQVVLDHQMDDMTTHNTRYKSHALTQKVFANMRRVGKGFSGVETPLFASMLVQSQQQAKAGVEVPITHAQPSTTSAPSTTELQDTTPTPHDTPPPYQPPTPHASPLKKKSKTSGFKRPRRVGVAQRVESSSDTVLGAEEDASKHRKITTIDADEGTTLVDAETDEEEVALDADKDKERALWVELKRLFEPDANDVLWKLQRYMHAPFTWRLYSDCGVHHVSSTKGHDIDMLTEKDYPLLNAIMILKLSEKLHVEEDNEMARDLVMKFFTEANRPRNRNRLEFRKCNMRLKTNIKPKEATFQVVLDAIALTPFYQAFLITSKFKELPLEHDILSFIRDLGHSGDIHFITDVSINYLHQAWRAFTTIINKCLSGKDTAYEKIRLSRTQILWEDQSISRRNKMFWHTARDDTIDGVDTQSKVPDEQQQKVTGTNEGVGVTPKVPDLPKYDSESDEESWTFNQDEEDAKEKSDMNDDNEQTKLDNDGDDLTHPNLSTFETEDQEEEEKAYDDAVSFDQRVYTPPDHQLTDEEENQEGEDEVKEGIVDNYFSSKMKEEVDVAVQLQTNKLRKEAQAENQEFLSQIEKYVTESLEAKVLVRSTNQPQTSYAILTSLSEFELKKILIDKIETSKSIDKTNIQKNLYNALVESYNSNKEITTLYGDVVILKRGCDDQEKMKTPSMDQTEGKSTYTEEHGQKVNDLEDQTHQEFNIGNDDVIHVREALDDDEKQWNPSSSLTHCEWHKTKTVNNRPPQLWITQMAQDA
nr:ribonuclease H-like domain-containing protein [Tanacetum cinerariifolium]